MIRRRPGSSTVFGARAATRLLVVIAVALVTITASGLRVLAPVENAALLVLTPARAALASVAGPLDDWFGNFGRFGDLDRENRQLRAATEQLSVEVARLREQEAAVSDLAGLLELRSRRPDDRFLPAAVVARSSSRYQRALAINRGSSDGVAVDTIVLAPGGSVIGRVTSVLPDFAWVTLVTDPTSNIPAIVQDGRFDGVLTGRPDDGLRLEMLPQGSTVKPGDPVVTSGLAGGFPKGLPLGRVIEVGGSDQDLFPAVYVEPLAALRNLENVVLLVSFRVGGVPRYPGSGPDARSGSAPPAGPALVPQDRRITESTLPGGPR